MGVPFVSKVTTAFPGEVGEDLNQTDVFPWRDIKDCRRSWWCAAIWRQLAITGLETLEFCFYHVLSLAETDVQWFAVRSDAMHAHSSRFLQEPVVLDDNDSTLPGEPHFVRDMFD